MNFRMDFPISTKNIIKIDRDSTESINHFGGIDISTILSLLIHEQEMCLHVFMTSKISLSNVL